MAKQKQSKAEQVERRLKNIVLSVGSIESLLEQIKPKEVKRKVRGAAWHLPNETRIYEFKVGSETYSIRKDSNGWMSIEYFGANSLAKHTNYRIRIDVEKHYRCR